VAISFPTSLDNFTNPSSGNTLDSPSHSLQHTDINDAVEAMQRKVGVGTAVAGSASAGQVLTISAAGTSTWSTPSAAGLTQIVPTSVAVGSGSGSVDANGLVTFTTASSISLNGCFSATYDSYRVIVIGSSTAGSTTFRFRTAGTDNSAASYQRQYLDATSTSVAGQRATGATSISSMELQTTANASILIMDIQNPFLSQVTGLTNISNLATTGIYLNLLTGAHTGNTSFDGFTIIQSTGSISGTIRVYGYKN
jgi:hypothetical protein